MKKTLPMLAVLHTCFAAGCSEASGEANGAREPAPCAKGELPKEFVWIETPVIEHTRDFHAYDPFMADDAPTNWTCPRNYADGTIRIELELVEASQPDVPIVYTFGWKPGTPDDSGAGYVRGYINPSDGVGAYEKTYSVKDMLLVKDGRDAGRVGDDWDWSNTWRAANGDAWGMGGNVYPFSVQTRVTLVAAD